MSHNFGVTWGPSSLSLLPCSLPTFCFPTLIISVWVCKCISEKNPEKFPKLKFRNTELMRMFGCTKSEILLHFTFIINYWEFWTSYKLRNANSILMSSKWGSIHSTEMLHFFFGRISLESPHSRFSKIKFLDAFDSSLFFTQTEITASPWQGKVWD